MEHYGSISLLPPIVAIALALATRRVLLPLMAGVLCGAMILAGRSQGNWWWSTGRLFTEFIWESVSNTDHLMVLAFTLLLGAMVGVIEATGLLRAVILRWAGKVSGSRGGQTLIASLGLAVFFDDYANTLLVGGTMKSTADELGISRAKLAYLVDSTAAPVAGLAVVSTWVATELSYLESGIAASGYGDSINAFEFFIQSIPYRFYPCLAIALVFIIARSGRDFGPMHRHESQAASSSRDKPRGSSEWYRGSSALPFMPVFVCLIVIMVVLLGTGLKSIGVEQLKFADQPAFSSLLFDAGNLLGSGDSYLALVLGGAAGLLAALVLGNWSSPRGQLRLRRGVISGGIQMMPAMLVLWLAWALSSTTEQLDTGGYLSSVLTDRLDVRLLPTCVFLLGGVIAFSTGTSWGTMAILTPIAVSLVLDMLGPTASAGMAGSAGIVESASPIALATFGSVLAGAIFGDHCSPISDTTVLSSRACGCDHVVHVTTQMPYAMLAAVVCVLTGTLPVAFGVPVWLCLMAGFGMLYVLVRFLGRKPAR